MVKRGLVVTAAHCVANYGEQQFYHNWHFYPGYRNGAAPFGNWTVYQAWIKTAYLQRNGQLRRIRRCLPGRCRRPHSEHPKRRVRGDPNGLVWLWMERLRVRERSHPHHSDRLPRLPRQRQRGWNATIRRDSCRQNNSSNTIIGSLMCGGSSGGPWLNNFGIRPTLTGTGNGTAPNPNIVVGVTSWGYIDNAVKQQGASPFTSNNIVSLVTSACNSQPAACQ